MLIYLTCSVDSEDAVADRDCCLPFSENYFSTIDAALVSWLRSAPWPAFASFVPATSATALNEEVPLFNFPKSVIQSVAIAVVSRVGIGIIGSSLKMKG
jgi:hypothetical protein